MNIYQIMTACFCSVVVKSDLCQHRTLKLSHIWQDSVDVNIIKFSKPINCLYAPLLKILILSLHCLPVYQNVWGQFAFYI